MLFSKREILLGSVASMAALPMTRAMGQQTKFGADAGGRGSPLEPYPGGYIVKAPPVPHGIPTLARVRQGLLQGIEHDGIRYFRGVPYARPPVGPLRFKAPEAAGSWKGTRAAVADPPASLQPNEILEAPGTSEDCLYLNIWAPGGRRDCPVYVYFHGGANVSGYALEHRVNGASFARDGVVCVNVGYRLGLLGFLELGDILGKEYAGSGNNALRDQVMALRWVRDNIHAFGGDPEAVTIGGQSAGAFDVCALVSCPSAQGLFRGAISQSGSGHAVATMAQAHAAAETVGQTLSRSGFRAADLPTLPSGAILGAQQALRDGSMNGVVDGAFLPDHPYRSVRKGIGKAVSLLIGFDRDELAVLGGGNLSRLSPAQFAAFRAFQKADPVTSEAQQLLRFQSVLQFGAPSQVFADNHAAAGGRSYFYQWNWGGATGRNAGQAFHGIEQPFVWDNLPSIAFRYVQPDPRMQALVGTVHKAWVAFITNGKPRLNGASWRRWKVTAPETMVIDQEPRMQSVSRDVLTGLARLLER